MPPQEDIAMIRRATITLLSAATVALAASPLHAEGPGGDMKAKQQEQEAKQEQMKREMRALEDKQRQEQRDMEDRMQKERKALHERHEQERQALRQKMSPK
jgi:Spy/CpxP family protein refolding chaperone